jgi:hypothetical protein
LLIVSSAAILENAANDSNLSTGNKASTATVAIGFEVPESLAVSVIVLPGAGAEKWKEYHSIERLDKYIGFIYASFKNGAMKS